MGNVCRAANSYLGPTFLAVGSIGRERLEPVELGNQLWATRRAGSQPRVERVLRVGWRIGRRVEVIRPPKFPIRLKVLSKLEVVELVAEEARLIPVRGQAVVQRGASVVARVHPRQVAAGVHAEI